MKTTELEKALANGEIKEFPAVTFPGMYPLYYVTMHCDILCAECATKNVADVTLYGAHMEGEPLICDECNAKIESAYGVPDED